MPLAQEGAALTLKDLWARLTCYKDGLVFLFCFLFLPFLFVFNAFQLFTISATHTRMAVWNKDSLYIYKQNFLRPLSSQNVGSMLILLPRLQCFPPVSLPNFTTSLLNGPPPGSYFLVSLPVTGALGCQSRCRLEPGAASHHKWVLPTREKGWQIFSITEPEEERAGQVNKQDVISYSPTQAKYLEQKPSLKGLRIPPSCGVLRGTQNPEGVWKPTKQKNS